MRTVRIVLWFAVATAVAVFAALWMGGKFDQPVRQAAVSMADIGGDFTLTDHEGNEVTQAALKGKPTLMFFGFTHCPDVCPTALFDMSQWMEELGADADKLNYFFVSVDPERDTPDIMKDYVSAFDPRITGLTGTTEQVAEMAKGYRVYYRKVKTDDGDYSVDHTAVIYLLDADGAFSGTIAHGEASKTAIEKMRRLLGS